MKQTRRSWAWLLAALCVGSWWGCSDDSPEGEAGTNNAGLPDSGNNAGQPDADASDPGDTPQDGDVRPDAVEDVDAEEPITCEPNAVVRCLLENTPEIEACNFRGNGYVQTRCPGRSVCREGACVEVACIPGSRVCLDEDLPGLCDDQGSGYAEQERCAEGVTCSQGSCLNPCELAAEQSSYIGCEYWPVELENNLLYDEDETSTPDAPFAMVLHNPQAEPAKVTVYDPDGLVQESVPEVYIPVGLVDPRFTSTTVTTQILDARGEPVVEMLEGPMEELSVPPGGLLQVLFPRRSPAPYATTISKIAWRVVSDRPVVAYQFNPICCNYSFTNDASILLPTSALTGNYLGMAYPSWRPSSNLLSPGTLTVVATQDDTEVVVRLGERRLFPNGADERLGTQPGEDGVMRVVLQRQEVLNLESSETDEDPVREVDLTGALIEANKPVAVFGGHSCTNIPFSQAACDHVEQQLFPLETWGRNFIAAPLKIRGPGAGTREATYWKILAQADNTQITLDRNFNDLQPLPQSGPEAAVPNCRDKLTRNNIITLNAGEYCEFGTRIGFGFDADQPIMVGGFMSGQVSTDLPDFGNQAGDPSFFLVPPSEQFRSEYDFLTPPTYALDFVTVVGLAGVPIRLDGETLDPEALEGGRVDTKGYIFAHIPLSDGPHHIEADAPFGIVVYAYDDFVSYAFTGGLNLTKINDR